MKINLLAIAGGLLGVICVLLPWTVTVSESVFGTTTTEMILPDFFHDDDPAFAFAVALFLLGSAFALITPLGCVGQFFGWLLFLSLIYEDLGLTENAIFDVTVSLGAGFYLGVIASIMIIATMLRPIGIGYKGKYLGIMDRFLTWRS